MQRSKLYWSEIACIGAFMFTIAACNRSDPVPDAPATQQSSKAPSGTAPSTNPATTASGQLDLETARRALVDAIESSNEPGFKSKLEDMSKLPVKGPSQPENSNHINWYFGTTTVIRIFDRTWSMEVAVPGDVPREIFGEFRKKADNTWEAVETSRHTRGNRASSNASIRKSN